MTAKQQKCVGVIEMTQVFDVSWKDGCSLDKLKARTYVFQSFYCVCVCVWGGGGGGESLNLFVFVSINE